MSHKRKRDYKAVFTKIRELLEDPSHHYPKVMEVVSDFEAAVWISIRKIFPTVEVKGCSFHLTQAMFKNLKKLGLGPDYQQNKATRKICREIMSLNLLPADKIEKRFKAIEIEVGGMRENCLLRKFCDYVDRTWMTRKRKLAKST